MFGLVAFCIAALVLMFMIVPGPTGPQDASSRLPPEEAVAACGGKSAGDACGFMDRDGTVEGECDGRPGILACAPGRTQDTARHTGEQAAPPVSTVLPDTGQATPGPTPGRPGGTETFLLTSAAALEGGKLPAEYTCDGPGSSPELSWSGAPAGTEEYALMMTTLPGDGTTKWNWVLYGISGNTTRIGRNSMGVGIVGSGSHGTVMMYDPPCSQGPGPKVYTFTLYALSSSPTLPDRAELVTGPVLTSALSPLILGEASLNLSYARPG